MVLGGALALGVLARPLGDRPRGVWLALAAGLWSSSTHSGPGTAGTLNRLDKGAGQIVRNIVERPPHSPRRRPVGRTAFTFALAGALIFTAWPLRRPAPRGATWPHGPAAALASRSGSRRCGSSSYFVRRRHRRARACGARCGARSCRVDAGKIRSHASPADPPGSARARHATVAIRSSSGTSGSRSGWAVEALLALALWRQLGIPKSGAPSALRGRRRAVRQTRGLSTIRAPACASSTARMTYLVPAAAMLAGAWLPARARRRARQAGVRPLRRRTRLQVGRATLRDLRLFAWLNLAVFRWFATGPELGLHLEHTPACDLALSYGPLYALALLGLRDGGGERRAAVTSPSPFSRRKVFLYDLGQLRTSIAASQSAWRSRCFVSRSTSGSSSTRLPDGVPARAADILQRRPALAAPPLRPATFFSRA
jgi:hypothetical protein